MNNTSFRHTFIFCALILIFTSSFGFQSSENRFYVDKGRPDNSGDGLSWDTAKRDVAAIMPLLSSGSIVEFADGVYNEEEDKINADNLPDGTADNWIVFKAANDGNVIFESEFDVLGDPNRSHYVIFEGFKFTNANRKRIYGKYWKFFRCAFEGGLPSENRTTFGIGTNVVGEGFGASHVLMEDCWFYGGGGRYKLNVFDASHIVVRRCVFRNDGGWGNVGGKSDPEAPMAIYSCFDVEVQNCIVVDAVFNSGFGIKLGAFNSLGNSIHPGGVTYFRGNIALNNEFSAFAYEGPNNPKMEGAYMNNCLGLDNAGNGVTIAKTMDPTGEVEIKNSVFMLNMSDGIKDNRGNINENVHHSIIAENTGKALVGIASQTNNNTYNNGGNNFGNITINPQVKGLRYPVRIESESTLDSLGFMFNITKRIGVSGTLYGETGYNVQTEEDLWPFPNEDRILNDFRSVIVPESDSTGIISGDRGFARTGALSINLSKMTLTKYIWEYLGNEIPNEIYNEQDNEEQNRFYVDKGRPDNSGDGLSWASAKRDIASIMPLLSPGSIVEFADGVYNEEEDKIIAGNLPDGTADNWIVFKAANDGNVIFESEFDVLGDTNRSHYVIFEGFKFTNANRKRIYGKYWKFFRCAFEGGLPSENRTTFGIGTNVVGEGFGASHVLMEDCWFYGGGGRYKLNVFDASHIVVRRCVFRNDGGWGNVGGKSDPEAPMAISSCFDVEVQNCIVVDAVFNSGFGVKLGAFNSLGNSIHPGGVTYFRGNIALNNEFSAFAYEGPNNPKMEGAYMNNCLGLDNAGNGVTIAKTMDPTGEVEIKNSVFILNMLNGIKDNRGNINENVHHSIIAENTGKALVGIASQTNNNTYNNGGNNIGNITINPQVKGLRYPVRIESESTLDSLGFMFNITKRIGVSGTLYGETGYNVQTEEDLWPFPNEDRILNDFRSVIVPESDSTGIISGDRGFAQTGALSINLSKMTLTKYIWEYLGNEIPNEIYNEQDNEEQNRFYVDKDRPDNSGDGLSLDTYNKQDNEELNSFYVRNSGLEKDSYLKDVRIFPNPAKNYIDVYGVYLEGVI